MSVLIKGMEMPKGCAVCPYCDRNWSKPKCHAKSVKGRYMSQKLFLSSRRQDWCPFVEVPTPHGRLIDADALMDGWMHLRDAIKYGNKNAEQQRHSYSTMMMYEIANEIDDAPTIIEAEE